jgi:hypothetical protein
MDNYKNEERNTEQENLTLEFCNDSSVMRIVDRVAYRFIPSFRNDASVSACDLKQEILLKLISVSDRLDANDPGYRSYIWKTAKCCMCDYLDKHLAKKRQVLEKDIEASYLELTKQRFQNNPFRQETIRNVRKAIKLLPDSSKKAGYDCLSSEVISEAARDNSIAPSTLRDQIKRSFKKVGLNRAALTESSVNIQLQSLDRSDERRENYAE